MSKNIRKKKSTKAVWLALALPVAMPLLPVQAADYQVPMYLTRQAPSPEIVNATKSRSPIVNVRLNNGQLITLEFYGDNIFRLFRDPSGGEMRDPEAKPEAQILVTTAYRPVTNFETKNEDGKSVIITGKIKIEIDDSTGKLRVTNLRTQGVMVEELEPAVIEQNHAEMKLYCSPMEHFYGGGMQNGRFAHRGQEIEIVNSNSWTDGGVASPTPFYWSTAGYGVLWNTFKPGKYNFGAEKRGTVKLVHEENYLDVFFLFDETPVAILNDYYQLTGNPVLLPKFGFYEGHLNAYNRDYWTSTSDDNGVLFEDGKRYKESQKDNGGIKESLNGENGNYQFSARAVVDRYKEHDMPLGWVLPNDGYGAGYGQTGSLDGNIENLKSFGDYARKNGVEIGLWTQSDLHPKAGIEPLLQRDIVKEVRDAGVRVLKTDVAWVGAGYSFGLNGVADVAEIMPQEGSNARPFIITLDGWAGTQRYAGLWSGDQTGGNWEYIRFHIPTYIGSGLSGQPNVSSDMDGIFGGKNATVNTRDYQWKTFTPMELNMDGWGSNEKYPQALGEPVASINRTYLKLKSVLMPYTYSIAHEAVTGKPMVAAMFLYYPDDFTLGKGVQYQYMYGPNFLVAPIYKATKADKEGNDVRNGIYLPKGLWIDYFTGNAYKGGRVLNEFDAPLWKLPVFVKADAIIPVTYPNNNINEVRKDIRVYEIYPLGSSSFTEYDDDGVTEAYRNGSYTLTEIHSEVDKKEFNVTVERTKGTYEGFEPNKMTEFRVNVTAEPDKVSAKIGGHGVKLSKASSLDEFESSTNTYYYDAAPNLNQFATQGTPFAQQKITKNPQLRVKLETADITKHAVELKVKGCEYDTTEKELKKTGTLIVPQIVPNDKGTAYTLTPEWQPVSNADYYEVEFNGVVYSTIKGTELTFEDLEPETLYSFRLRAVNKNGTSDWTTFKASTKANPLEFAIKGITGSTTCQNQGGQGIDKLFDFDENSTWHTEWKTKAVPFDIIIDLHSLNTLDKLRYLPREDGGNGVLLKGIVSCSLDKQEWLPVGTFEWANNGEPKEFKFRGMPIVQYVKISVQKGNGDFGSGQQLYVFREPGSKVTMPGDINHDGKVDMDDFTSYMNYTGLRKGDADFDYVSAGDVNQNGLIDAYDISTVGTKVRGGVDTYNMKPLKGTIQVTTNKPSYVAGNEVFVTVKGVNLQSVNALSFALPYNAEDFTYIGVEQRNMKEMENLTYDRLHTNGKKALYPTFVNTGDKATLDGSDELFIIKFRAKRNAKFPLNISDGMLVDKDLNSLKF